MDPKLKLDINEIFSAFGAVPGEGQPDPMEHSGIVIVLSIFGIMLALFLTSLFGFFGVLLGLVSGGGIILAAITSQHKQHVLKSDVVNLDFFLTDDVCIKKFVESDNQEISTDYHYLQFARQGKVNTDFLTNHLAIKSQTAVATIALYRTASVGDAFLILHFANSNSVCLFNKKYWELDSSQFERKGAEWVPIK